MADEAWLALGERLREARTQRRLGQESLARTLGVERTAVAKLEAGQRRMSALELMRASDALRVPMSWIVNGPAAAMVSRRPATTDAAIFDVDVRLQETWEQTSLLTDDGHLKPATLPAGLSMNTPEEATAAAADLRRHLGWSDDDPLGPMADVAAEVGLHVVVIDSSIDGASMTPRPGLGVAVLGGRTASGRRRFTCAHEIGHHVLGDEYTPAGSVGDSRDEREARIDTFAAALLLPPEARTATDRQQMIRLAGRYRVSWSLAVGACGRPDVGPTPTRADFVTAGIEIPDDLRIGHRPLIWRQAVLAARDAHDLTDDATLHLMGEPRLTLDDLRPLEEPAW